MKTLALIIMAIVFTLESFAQVNSNYTYVNGYYRSNGTYVQGYYRTKPNNSVWDNYSTYPNVNPWTGQQGTVKPDYYYNSGSYGNSYGKSNNIFYDSYYTLPSQNLNSWQSIYDSYYDR